MPIADAPMNRKVSQRKMVEIWPLSTAVTISAFTGSIPTKLMSRPKSVAMLMMPQRRLLERAQRFAQASKFRGLQQTLGFGLLPEPKRQGLSQDHPALCRQ